MVNVHWTDKAEKRLHETYKRIAQDSPFYGRQTVLNIVKRAKILETMPKIGRVVPEFNRDDVREVFHKIYRIVYKIISDTWIDIITVAYGSVPLENFGPFPDLGN
jgi:plasmid stabilization system protein ParE